MLIIDPVYKTSGHSCQGEEGVCVCVGGGGGANLRRLIAANSIKVRFSGDLKMLHCIKGPR